MTAGPSRRNASRAKVLLVLATIAVVVIVILARPFAEPATSVPGSAAQETGVPPAETPARVREASAVALPFAAWARAAVRGESGDVASTNEREAFPHVDRWPWRSVAAVLTKAEIDAAWNAAIGRIERSPLYAGLGAGGTAQNAQNAALGTSMREKLLARAADYFPLGPDPQTKLERFARIGKGVVHLPDPAKGDVPSDPKSARIFVLSPQGHFVASRPGTESESSKPPVDEPKRQPPNRSSKSSVRDLVRSLIAEQMGVDVSKIKDETVLVMDLNADELDMVELFMEFEDEFNLNIPDEDAAKLVTVGDVIRYVEQRLFPPAKLK